MTGPDARLDLAVEHPVLGVPTLRGVLTHRIRELAQHTGPAEILVEQIRAVDDGTGVRETTA